MTAEKRTWTLSELAKRIGASVFGDGSILIAGVAPTHLAESSELTFLADLSKAKLLDGCRAAAILVPTGTRERFPERTILEADDVGRSFDEAAALFHPVRQPIAPGVSTRAFVNSTARLGKNVAVGDGAYIGADVELGDSCAVYPNGVILDGTTIGQKTVIFPNVTIYENCRIGARCRIHSGAVIGAYGFGYDSSADGHKISAQLGNVVIEDDVEVGANSTIDRATHGSTIIGGGTKIDNLVMIAHNCRLGRHNLICAHTGIAGSTTTGDFVVMAGRVGVKDHVHIGNGAILGAMAGVMENIPEKGQYVGIPATELKEWFKKQAALAKLPAMRREFIALQNEVKRLTERMERER